MKTCTKCGEAKAVDDFYVRTDQRLYPHCKRCMIQRAMEREREMLATPEGRRRREDVRRRYNRRKNTGCSDEMYDQLYEQQGGCCAICRMYSDVLCADHDHVTGVIRGLLCHACNRGLGNFRDNADALHRAAKYLEGATLYFVEGP